MTRQIMITKHPAVITATEVHPMGSQGVAQQILRFQTLPELLDHFRSLGVPEEALQAAQTTFDATGLAALTFEDRAR
jgi:hypothetical protein